MVFMDDFFTEDNVQNLGESTIYLTKSIEDYQSAEQYCTDCVRYRGETDAFSSPVCIPCTGKTQQVMFDENTDRKAVNVLFPPQGDCGTGRILEVKVSLPELSPTRLINVAVILKENCINENGVVIERVVAQRVTQIKVQSDGLAKVPKFTFLIPEDGSLKQKRCFFTEVIYHYAGTIKD